jgi:SAM-dependent methyltransferase
MDEVLEVHQQNRRAWNQAARQYAATIEDAITFLRSGGMNFVASELEYIGDLREWCRRAVHLQCAGGTDTLSLWNLGATEVVGVDISEAMLQVAQQKSAALSAPAAWILSDVLETPAVLDGTADLVYTGRGALNWIMDLDRWAAVPYRLLKPGGRLFIFEGHPITWILDEEAEELRLHRAYGDYFQRGPIAETGWPEQYIPASVIGEAPEISFERLWDIGNVVTAVVRAGFEIVRLGEHPDPYWDQFPRMLPEIHRRIPHTYGLLARKPQ